MLLHRHDACQCARCEPDDEACIIISSVKKENCDLVEHQKIIEKKSPNCMFFIDILIFIDIEAPYTYILLS